MPSRPVLTQVELARLLAPISGTVFGLRDRALLLVLYRSALHRRQLLALDLDDVAGLDLAGDGEFDAASALDAYLELARPSLVTDHVDSERALFLSKSGRRLHAQQLKTLLDRLRRAARVRKPVTPCELRRAHVAHALAAGADVRDLQTLLGLRRPGLVFTQFHLPRPSTTRS